MLPAVQRGGETLATIMLAPRLHLFCIYSVKSINCEDRRWSDVEKPQRRLNPFSAR